MLGDRHGLRLSCGEVMMAVARAPQCWLMSRSLKSCPPCHDGYNHCSTAKECWPACEQRQLAVFGQSPQASIQRNMALIPTSRTHSLVSAHLMREHACQSRGMRGERLETGAGCSARSVVAFCFLCVYITFSSLFIIVLPVQSSKSARGST